MDKYDLHKTMTSGLQPFPFHRTSGAGGTPDIRIRKKKNVLFVISVGEFYIKKHIFQSFWVVFQMLHVWNVYVDLA